MNNTVYTTFLVQYDVSVNGSDYRELEKICVCDSEQTAINIAKKLANEKFPVYVVRKVRSVIDGALQDIELVFTQPKINEDNGGEQND